MKLKARQSIRSGAGSAPKTYPYVKTRIDLFGTATSANTTCSGLLT